MKETKKRSKLLLLTAAMVIVLAACGGNDKNSTGNSNNVGQDKVVQTENPENTKEDEPLKPNGEIAETKKFTDWTGHEVEVPVDPKRVIFHGETTGDLLALGVKPVGILKSNVDGSVYDEQLKSAEDVGFPFNLEKAMTLNADLIIFGNADAAQYEQISKVAPTVTFDTFASLEDRMRTLGELFGKQEEAEKWLADYDLQLKDMWKQLHDAGIGQDETASVFTMYPGERLFAMARTGLSQVLYEKDGFKPTPAIQQALDQDQGFVELSMEKLPEFAGDRIFILTPIDKEAVQDIEQLLESSIWKSLPAVKSGKVYTFHILEAYSDAISREWIAKNLPKVLIS
ncbi:ABC transporter substrate-binding protein [Paenibacillus sp. GXUN7292]|uniref:ABC transporter substrate-binding protein n=1 Tax=Paenibacillus sp. GXUN7292 TaxID=3422499 RepID=UPI003D7EC94C